MKVSENVFGLEEFVNNVHEFNNEVFPSIKKILEKTVPDFEFNVFCLGSTLARIGLCFVFSSIYGEEQEVVEKVINTIVDLAIKDAEEGFIQKDEEATHQAQ